MGAISVITRIDAPIGVCFDAARDVSLHVRSAAFSGERLVAPGKLDGLLELNDLVCFEGRHFGVRQRFCARIVDVDRPRRFVDEMVSGTFRWMRHIHSFESHGAATIMRDDVAWAAPLGILGRLADPIFLEHHMRRFVETKQRALKGIIEADVTRLAGGDPSRRSG